MQHNGFTLIELLVTVVIVAILASVALPMSELVVQRNKEQELRTALQQIRSALDAYKKSADTGHIYFNKAIGQSGYPKSLNELVDGVEDLTSPTKSKIQFLRRIPRNPFFLDSTVAAEKTWGKRSYGSPPDAPIEGNDVFDVYPLTNSIGINGVPYREW